MNGVEKVEKIPYSNLDQPVIESYFSLFISPPVKNLIEPNKQTKIQLKIHKMIDWKLGPKHRLRFLCEVRVNGIPYVGAGNSTNKKDAEKNAARDFVNFLVRTGEINASDVPANVVEQGGALPARMEPPKRENVPVFQVIFNKKF